MKKRLSFILWLCCLNNVYALTYEEAVHQAAQQALVVKKSTVALSEKSAQQKAAGQLPDPSLRLAYDNFPIEGDDAYSVGDSMTMQKVTLMQEVPNGDKRNAQKKVAQAQTHVAEKNVNAAQAQAMRQTAAAWLTLYYAQQKNHTLGELSVEYKKIAASLDETVKQGRVANERMLFDAQLAISRIENEKAQLAVEAKKAEHLLKRLLGDQVDVAVRGQPPTFHIHEQHIMQAVEAHPELAALDAQLQQAQAELALVQADKKPDWGLGVGYGNRAHQYEDMMSLEFSMSLPLFSGSRQTPRLDAARAQVTQTEIENEMMRREHTQEVRDALVQYHQLDDQIKRLQGTQLPLLKKSLAQTKARIEAAQTELSEIMTAQQMVADTEIQLLDARYNRDAIAAWLTHAFGGDL